MTATRFSILQFAIGQLTDDNPDHWDDKGLPNLLAVSQSSGLAEVTRTEINKFGRTRKLSTPPRDEKKIDDVETARPLSTDQIEALRNAILGAENGLAALGAHIVGLQARVRHQREIFAQALKEFQNEFAHVTPEQLVRQHIASENELRRQVAAGEIEPAAPPRKANSVIDQMSGRGSSADRSYGSGYRRGAVSLEQLGHMRAQAARAKLPSQR
jgi:hypothetical protein